MRRFLTLWICLGLSLAAISIARAQQRPSQPATPLAACGTTHGHVEVLCGVHSPEDLEPTPDGKYLIVAQMASPDASGNGQGLALFNIASKAFHKMPITAAPDAGWGSPSCPGPIGNRLVAHGISLARRTDGRLELYVINHNTRQSMEMYELKRTPASWSLLWRGCVVSSTDFNDVAAMADGGFVATHPTALIPGHLDRVKLYTGITSGYVVRWTRANGEQELPATRLGYPNGLLVTPDSRSMYLNAWTGRAVHSYDLQHGQDTHTTPLTFMPDNLSWVDPRINTGVHGHPILSTGIVGRLGNCPANSTHLCVQQFRVAQIDPQTMQSKMLYESPIDDPMISGASVGVEVGNALYIGSFEGDRILKITLHK